MIPIPQSGSIYIGMENDNLDKILEVIRNN
jgi:hypothetical protein